MQNGKRTRSKILHLRIYTLTNSRRNFHEFKSKEVLIFFVQKNAIFKSYFCVILILNKIIIKSFLRFYTFIIFRHNRL